MNGMPPVTRCDVNNCFYNRSNACHAPAINIGGNHPNCDTFITDATHIHRSEGAAVGACHVKDCRWNNEMLCTAPGISVIPHSGHADCATFEKR